MGLYRCYNGRFEEWTGNKKFRFQERCFTALTVSYHLKNGGNCPDLPRSQDFCEDKITCKVFEMYEPLYKCESASRTWKINAPLERGIDFMYRCPNTSKPSHLF